jgi:hypothetical protein
VSSEFAGRSSAPFRSTRPRCRAGKMGADRASPSKVFERRYRLAFGVTFFGGTTAVSSHFREAQPRPIPANNAALARGKYGRRRSIALQTTNATRVFLLDTANRLTL